MADRLSVERLNLFRLHASAYPVGDIALLIKHIDYQRELFLRINDLLKETVIPHTRGQEYWLLEIYRMLQEGGE